MRCAIMQPTYLPYLGYFSLISKVDKFVILDNVQFEKQSWQSRNRILSNNKIVFLSVPIRKTGLDTLIKDVQISMPSNWIKKHLKTLVQAYLKFPFGDHLIPFLEEYYENVERICADNSNSLSLINQFFIYKLCNKANINHDIILSSDLNLSNKKRSNLLIEIIQKINCSEYISPIGSLNYLKEDRFTEISNIELQFHEYEPIEYPQYKSEIFEPRLSVIDFIANCGFEKIKDYC